MRLANRLIEWAGKSVEEGCRGLGSFDVALQLIRSRDEGSNVTGSKCKKSAHPPPTSVIGKDILILFRKINTKTISFIIFEI